MPTRDTSLAAYDAFCASGKLSRDTKLVLRTLVRHGPLADYQIADILGWEKARVSARRNDLVTTSNTGAVVTAGYTVNEETGRTVRRWQANLSPNIPLL